MPTLYQEHKLTYFLLTFITLMLWTHAILRTANHRHMFTKHDPIKPADQYYCGSYCDESMIDTSKVACIVEWNTYAAVHSSNNTNITDSNNFNSNSRRLSDAFQQTGAIQ